jgi:uncharacterized membrane protein YczE
VANVTYACLYSGLAVTLFSVSLYAQNVLGYSPLRGGLAWIAMNLPFLVASMLAGRLQRC